MIGERGQKETDSVLGSMHVQMWGAFYKAGDSRTGNMGTAGQRLRPQIALTSLNEALNLYRYKGAVM